MKRILLALGFGVAAILVAYGITPAIYLHVAHGGSEWTYAWLLLPLGIAVLGIAIAAKDEHRRADAKWTTYQEQQARAASLEHTWRTAAAILAPDHTGPYTQHPLAMNGRPAVLTDAQRELAAEHACDKRHMDGQGDQ